MRVRSIHRFTAVAVASVIVACGGGAGDGADATDMGPSASFPDSGDTTLGTESTVAVPTSQTCPAEDVCVIEVAFSEILLEAAPSSITLAGTHAWVVTPDNLAVVEVDLGGLSVIRSFVLDQQPVDLVADGDSLWVTTYEFSPGPLLRLAESDGTLEATIEPDLDNARSAVVLDGALWAVIDGQGKMMRLDVASNQITDVFGGNDYAGGSDEVPIVAGGGFIWTINAQTGSVQQVDPGSRTIVATIGDLGYSEEESGGFTSILSDGPKALAATAEGIWVVSDTPHPTDQANVVGGGALFLLDSTTGAVIRRIDLILEPAFRRPGLVVTEDAVWYLDFANGYPVRVDFDTGRQTYVRLDGPGAGLVADGTTLWVAEESYFASNRVVGIDLAEAAAASAALDG